MPRLDPVEPNSPCRRPTGSRRSFALKYILAVLLLLLPGIACAEETLSEKCTSDAASSYRGKGDRQLFVYDVENTCEFRLRCELNITIVNALGLNHDHKIITIEPRSHGRLMLWIKAAGGMSTRRHTCTQI
jgi:hypothetical protein